MRSSIPFALSVLLFAGCVADPESPSGSASPSVSPPAVEAFPEKPVWKALPDAMIPRAEHCAAQVGSKFYVTGGLIVPNPVSLPGPAGSVPAAVPTTVTEIFDAATNAWSRGPDFPANVDHCLGVGLGEWGYIFHNSGSYRIKSGGAWEAIPKMPHNHGATGVAEEIEGKIYVTAGSGSESGFVDVYDPAANAWTSFPETAKIPTTRNHMGGAAVGGRLYAVGGDTAGHSVNTAANEEFDPATGTWTARADLPVVRGSLHAFGWFGRVVVMGGQNGATNVPSFADVHAYDPATDTWSPLPKMTNPRHGFAGGVWEGKIYVFGGAPQQGVSSFAKADVLMPA